MKHETINGDIPMRYASYITPHGLATWGVEEKGILYDLGPSGLALAPSLKAAIENGVFGSDLGDFGVAPNQPSSAVRFLPPISDPAKILCIGINYENHQKETGRAAPSAPTVFTRFADTQIGHLEPAIRPDNTDKFDYEGEMALVIGAPAYRVSEENAQSVVAGYAVYNDFTARDWQRAASQWTPGKNFPGTGGFGPYLVDATDVPDVGRLVLETRVNGEVRQSASLADLIFSVPALVAYISAFTPLVPGDIIVTGTPGGVGFFMEPQGLLVEGDVVDVEITGIGTLTNRVLQG
jgi:2-keto-4-pentenoate hydratase/2-oxohepta-3-ene-1,7-dioic acid hydratase in catechol pathway